jgi:hypothetical protein
MTMPKNDAEIVLGRATKRKIALTLCRAMFSDEDASTSWSARCHAAWLSRHLNGAQDDEASAEASVLADEYKLKDADL